MDAIRPDPLAATPPSYWRPPAANGSGDEILPHIRARLVGLVAAMMVQATIALLSVLPRLPGAPDPDMSSDPYGYASQPVNFWIQFAVLEFIAAIVVSFAFGPVVRIRDLPAIGRLVLGLAFVAVPAVAIVLGAIPAAQGAATYGSGPAASSWLTTIFFATLFFGLPLMAAAVPALRARRDPTPA